MSIHQETADRYVDHGFEKGQDSTAGLTVIALLLALILGFSAVDQHASKEGSAASLNAEQVTLDGRGKWGGYLK